MSDAKYTFDIDVSKALTGLQQAASAVTKLDTAMKDANKTASELSGGMKSTATASNNVSAASENTTKKLTKEEQEAKKLKAAYEGLANARYAMYDVARALTAVSAVSLGIVGTLTVTGARVEEMFASVKRTSMTAGSAFKSLKADIMEVGRELPESLQNLTDIATIAGQLDIPAKNIADFTKQVAMFTATTDVSAEKGAEQIGRVAQLAKVAGEDYDNLAAAIYQVGITSVSTESQILHVAEQISATANQAGFAAEEIVGLASATASVGVQAENARGSYQRSFNIIEGIVRSGGSELQKLADISQMSAKEFAEGWENNTADTFTSFIEGLSRLSDSGEDLNYVLGQIGIVGVRNTDVLRRLAGNVEVLNTAMSESRTAFAEGTALAEGYSVVAETLSARTARLRNSIQQLFASMSELSVLKEGVELLIRAVNVMRALSETPAGKVLTVLNLVILAVVGTVGLLGAAMAMAVATVYALTTATEHYSKQAKRKVTVAEMLTQSLIRLAVAQGRVTEAEAASIVTSKGSAGAMQALALSMGGAATAAKALGTALKFAVPILGAVSIGWAIFDGIKGKSKDASKPVVDLTADLEGLQAAMDADTIAFEEGEKSITTFTRGVTASGEALEEGEFVAAAYASAKNNLGKSVDEVTKSVRAETVAIGENTREWLLNQIKASEAGATIFQTMSEGIDRGLDPNVLLDSVLSGRMPDISAYIAPQKAEIEALTAVINEYYALLGKSHGSTLTDEERVRFRELSADIKDVISQRDALEKGIKTTSEAFSQMAEDIIPLTRENEYFGKVMNYVTGELADNVDEIGNAEEAYDRYRSVLMDTAIETAQLRDDLYDLGETFADNGTTLDLATEAGRANAIALEGVVEAIRNVAGEDSDVFDAMITQLIEMMNQAGFARSELTMLYSLISGGAIDVGVMNNAAERMGNAFQTAFGKAKDGVNGTTSAAKKATAAVKKQVRTLTDYVNDLSKVMRNAFDFRFGFSQSRDNTASTFYKIADSMAEATKRLNDLRQSINSLKADLMGLASDKSVLQYQLMVADLYGDTLGSERLRAKIADNEAEQAEKRADLAEATQEMAEAQQFLKKDLKGLDEASIEHRSMVEELAEAYREQIVAYANTGASQSDVMAYSKKLQRQFKDEARQLGYSESQLGDYLATFEDYTYLVREMPKNLTLTVDANPAVRALREYEAALNSARNNSSQGFSEPKLTTGQTLKDGYANYFNPTGMVLDDFKDAYLAARTTAANPPQTRSSDGKELGLPAKTASGYVTQFTNAYNTARTTAKNPVPLANANFSKFSTAVKYIADLYALLNSMKTQTNPNVLAAQSKRAGELERLIKALGTGFMGGGYTGDGAKDAVKGVVHGGEYVFTKERTSQLGVPFLNALGRGSFPGFMGGGPVSVSASMPSVVVVELSPTDRRLIASAGNVTLNVDGRQVATAVNNSNLHETTSRGVG